jgi:hypothetical protein
VSFANSAPGDGDDYGRVREDSELCQSGFWWKCGSLVVPNIPILTLPQTNFIRIFFYLKRNYFSASEHLLMSNKALESLQKFI